MNGQIMIQFAGQMCFFQGGPYDEKPSNSPGIKMAEEIDLPCTIDIPTQDYNVPNEEILRAGLMSAYKLFSESSGYAGGPTPYVGCMGGIGRTGLFFAAFAKMSGVRNPVEFVRENYHPLALETKQQEDYIANLKVWDLRWKARWMFVRLFVAKLFRR